jgi:hypothetical protein
MECKKITECTACSFHELNSVKECKHTGHAIKMLCDKTEQYESCKANSHPALTLLWSLVAIAILFFVFYRYIRRLYSVHVLKSANFDKV